MKLGKKFLFLGAKVCLALCATSVYAQQGIERYVQQVARTHQNIAAIVGQRAAQVIYVQKYEGCEHVAVLRKGVPAQNFKVCAGTVSDKHSVAPRWPTDGLTHQLLSLVIGNALAYGQSQSDDENGYHIAAQRLADVGNCAVIEVQVSYQGDLSDWDRRTVCGQ